MERLLARSHVCSVVVVSRFLWIRPWACGICQSPQRIRSRLASLSIIMWLLLLAGLGLVLVWSAMEGELQEMREVIAQLRADNERLQQEQAAAVPGPGTVPSNLAVPPSAPSTATAPLVERQHFEPWGRERLQSCHWLQLKAANGLAIPYVGYLELDMELCGQQMERPFGGPCNCGSRCALCPFSSFTRSMP
ncbi:hypothetical protein N1851_021419 [Merluccius polli]|uniref:Uncharacterized protein n=1 Tax=Merluccius polli TaxID=89951 RepID=A0AA47MJX0_MERPO|nr:hypothetical protein N1851_021419 [Merluccius polli]